MSEICVCMKNTILYLPSLILLKLVFPNENPVLNALLKIISVKNSLL